MNIAILASPDSWYARDLRRAAEGRHRIDILPFSEIRSFLSGAGVVVETGGRNLAEYSAVLVRTMPPGTLEQVVFRMDALARCEQSGVLVVNPPRAIEAAVDKYLASARLAAAGLATPRTAVCQTVEEALQAFDLLGGDVVVKPLFGSEGRGISRVSDKDVAWRAFKLLVQLGAVVYLQEFVPHEGFDLRLLVLGEQVFGVTRRNPDDWRTNVSRGATTEPLAVTDELREQALRAARAIGAPLAGVDILPSRCGERYVLEVNAVPGWRALARTLELDIAGLVLDYVATRAKQGGRPGGA
jgi:ribosomal protein S6--L-glutamate ligase